MLITFNQGTDGTYEQEEKQTNEMNIMLVQLRIEDLRKSHTHRQKQRTWDKKKRERERERKHTHAHTRSKFVSNI